MKRLIYHPNSLKQKNSPLDYSIIIGELFLSGFHLRKAYNEIKTFWKLDITPKEVVKKFEKATGLKFKYLKGYNPVAFLLDLEKKSKRHYNIITHHLKIFDLVLLKKEMEVKRNG